MAEMNDDASAVTVESDDTILTWLWKCCKENPGFKCAGKQFEDSPQLQDSATSKGFSVLSSLLQALTEKGLVQTILRITSAILIRFSDDFASAIADKLLLSLHHFSRAFEPPVMGVLTGGIIAGHAASAAMSFGLSLAITPLFIWLRAQLCYKYLEWRLIYEHDKNPTIWKWLADARKPKVLKEKLTEKDRDEIKKYTIHQAELIMTDLLTLPITLVTGFLGTIIGGFICSAPGAAVGGVLGTIFGTAIAALLIWKIKWRPKKFKKWLEKKISTDVNKWIETKMKDGDSGSSK